MRTSLCLTVLLLGASRLYAAPDEPEAKVVGSKTGPITGFVEEKDSFTVTTAKGKFEVVIEPSARAARKLIHAERSKELFGGKDLAVEQAAMVKRTKDIYASMWIGITPDGVLVGANKFRGPGKNDHTVNYFTLDGGGKTKKVVMSGGTRNKKPAVFVRLSEGGDVENIWMVLTYIDTLTLNLDFEVKGKATGAPGHIDVYPD